MKTLTVTEKNINHIRPFQGTSESVSVGDVLDVVIEEKGRDAFIFLTNWKPTYNTLKMIERGNEPEAKRWGWDDIAEVNKKAVEEKKDAVFFKRYTIAKKDLD